MSVVEYKCYPNYAAWAYWYFLILKHVVYDFFVLDRRLSSDQMNKSSNEQIIGK